MDKNQVGYYAGNVYSDNNLLVGTYPGYEYPKQWCKKCGKRMRFDPGSESLANGVLNYTGFHNRPSQHICDNYRCPESTNFEAYLKGEYTP